MLPVCAGHSSHQGAAHTSLCFPSPSQVKRRALKYFPTFPKASLPNTCSQRSTFVRGACGFYKGLPTTPFNLLHHTHSLLRGTLKSVLTPKRKKLYTS